MARSSPPLAVFGATGYTGRLVCEEARKVGLPLRLVGRRADRLREVAVNAEETRLAEARDEAGLRAAFEGAFAVVSCAGPFLELGTGPLRAALAAGAHYVDTSGEQAFARLAYESSDGEAKQRGVAVLTSFGFDFVPGDLAARLAADGLEPLDEVAVAYSASGTSVSRGTRRTLGSILRQPQVAYVGGTLVPSSFAATTRSFEFPFGRRAVVEWGGTEPLTVPRHTQVREVRSYVRAPAPLAKLRRLLPLGAPLLRLAAGVLGDPSEKRRRDSRFAVVAEAHGPRGSSRATLTGRDVYRLTALIVTRAAQALLAGDVHAAGALAPAEAFDARAFVERLAPLLTIESVAPIEARSRA